MRLFSKILVIILLSMMPKCILANKRALIIAIGNYKPGSGWPNLAAKADLTLIKETLKKQGFKESDILVIQDENATKQGIIAKVRTLINTAELGDKIVIHFSGHGQQVIDLNGDEADKYDEAIVPYDAPSEVTGNTYRGEKHIIDDEINIWINQLRAKIGSEGHLFLILDSCHSGTASRGLDITRGGKPPIGSYQMQQILQNDVLISDYLEPQTIKNQNNGIGKFIMFTGASASQENKQTVTENGTPIGSLSYAVSVAFGKMGKGTSYEGLFAKVRDVMHQKVLGQTPTIEGDIQYEVFNGDMVTQEPYYLIKKIMERGKEMIKITGGYLSNVFEGAKFDFLPSGSQNVNSAKAIARGKVISANNFESIIELEEGSLPSSETSVWGFQTVQSFGKYKIAVKFGDFKDQKLKKGLVDTLSTRALVLLNSEQNDLEIIQENDSISINLISTGLSYSKIPINEYIKMNLTDRILDYGRAKIISAVEMTNPDYKAAVSLRPAKLRIDQNDRYVPEFEAEKKNGFPTFDTAQQAWFTIKNTGDKTFYFTLLDIQPDGKINVIFPDESKNYRIDDVKLDAGEERGFPISGFTPPFGVEKFKVIMSPSPDDFSFLSSINRNRAVRSIDRGQNPIGSLFMDLTDGTMNRTTSRGINTPTLPTTGGTASFTFRIIEANK